jgi:hypothetical protein
MLGLPQVWRNHQRQSTEGFRYVHLAPSQHQKLISGSRVLLVSWFGGDAFKTFYFYYSNAPFQFLLCGITQLTVDCVALAQWFFYPE